tara:strand:- start:1350 stop:2441 length:1092 start_codon:yes stop_codon:yes gene_type:complete
LLKNIKLFLSIAYFFFTSFSNASECNSQSSIKIGLLENNYIDYKHYLYYELGNYASNNDLVFEIDIIDKNIDEFDIIFGEYEDLIKLSNYKIDYPEQIKEFYKNNSITISNNLLPLDLETFILVTKGNYKKIKTLEDLSIFFDPHRYTLGMSYEPKNHLAKFLNYNTNGEKLNYDDSSYELLLNLMSDLGKNINKNLLTSDYLEVFNSFEMNENVYSLFNDGVLLNRKFDYDFFQLFPQKLYKWNDENGIFTKNDKTIPFSYFGFSAYLNKQNNLGFICHLVDPIVRMNTFRNFNISIGPLSNLEVKDFEKLPEGYIELLKNKNKNIVKINEVIFSEDFGLIKKILMGNEIYKENLVINNYLN